MANGIYQLQIAIDEEFRDIAKKFKEGDYRRILAAQLDTLESDERSFFQNERSPGGRKWKPLAQSTIKRKGHNVILRETGRLESSLVSVTGDSIAEATHRGLLFGTRAPHAWIHQDGAGHVPQREHTGITSKTLDKIVKDIAAATVSIISS